MKTFWGLTGVFLGGALPWLEAVVVIPAGALAGLPLIPVIAAGAIGNVLTIGVAAFAGEWLKERFVAWRRRRKGEESAEKIERAQRRSRRIEQLMDRGGLPLLALVGPIGLGTQASAVIAVASGSSALRSFIWISIGTIAWCITAGIAAVQGFQLLGIGA